MTQTAAQFAQAVVSSGLIGGAELQQFQAAQIAAGEKFDDAQAFARSLVRHGKLTKYQAAAIYQGKFKGLVLGNYVVLDKLGAGGMGQVFKALHTRMERVVALKVLPAEATKSPDNVKRFHREVKAAARLVHPNIVVAHDADEADGTHFLVMEHVAGKDLSALVKEHGPLPVAQAVECIRQAAQGLAYAHKRGVIHRDIKPANLLLDNEGTVKILDMGLARLEGQLQDAASVAGLTQSGQVMGTVDYMSPEQAEETRGVDARADQYSLGCTLWVLLTGRPMYGGTTTISKLMAHRTAPAPSLRAARADVPEALEAVYQRLVAKEPDERYASMDEVIAALATALGEAAPAQLDGPSSSDSRLTEFFRQIGGASTTAPPVSVTAIDGETEQYQSEKIDTGTELRIRGAQQGARDGPVGWAPPTKPIAPGPAVEKPAAKLVGKAHPTPAARQLHPLVLFAGMMAAGIGTIGALLALLLWLILPGGDVPSTGPITPTVVGDGGNYALDFDGRTRYVEIPTLQLPNGPLTIEAWITPRKMEREAIFHCGGESFVSLHTFQGSLGFWREAPSYLKSVNNRRLRPGERIHVAGVWDGNQLRAFVNGQASGPGNQIPPEMAVNKMLVRAMIGGELRNGKLAGMFDGQIDELRVSTTARYTSNFNIVAPYGRMKVDDQTLALYHFDEGAGEVLVDSSGRNHHGKIVGAKWVRVAMGAGDEGQSGPRWALQFDGESSVEIPTAAWKNSAEFTLEAWCVDAGSDHGSVVVLSNQFGLFTQRGEAGATTWKAFVRDAATNKAAYLGSEAESFRPGVEQHIAAVFDETGLRLYVDGKLANSLSSVKSFQQTATRIHLGEQFKGRIQAVRISDKARYSANFQPLRRWQPDAATLALYHFDEGTGDVLVDSSGKNHHGKIVGAKWVRVDEATAPSNFALYFDGESSVELPETIKLDATADFTLEAYVTARQMARYGAVVGSKLRTEIIQNSTQEKPFWSFAAEAGQGHSVASTSQQFALDRRTHLAAVRRGQRYSLFVDGKLAASREMELPLRAIDQPWRIGKAFIGEIDEVRLSQVARYESEFAPERRFARDVHTLALYHFDEGAGDVLRDATGKHHGKIVGAKWVQAPMSEAAARFVLQFARDDRVELPPLPLAGLKELCIEAWLTPQPNQSEQDAVVFDAKQQAGLKVNPRGYWDVVFSNGQGTWVALGSLQPRLYGRATHIAGTLSPDHMQLFIDGKRVAYKPVGEFHLGKQNNAAVIGKDWVGTLQGLRISKVTRYEQDFAPPARLAEDEQTLALYHFDEGAGDVLRDATGDHHGKIVGAKWVPVGPAAPESALRFDGEGDYVSIPTLTYAGGPFTVEARLRCERPRLSAIVHGGGTARMTLHGVHNGFGFHTGVADVLGRREIRDVQPTSGWRHVAGVWDGRALQLFVDGQPDTGSELAGADDKGPSAFYIGAAPKGAPPVMESFFEGEISEVRVSNSARYTQAFVPPVRLEADEYALALYHFEEGGGNELRDASGNDHHGKIVGAKWVQVEPLASTPRDDFALEFDGSAEQRVATPVTYPADGVFTIEGWATRTGGIGPHSRHCILGTWEAKLKLEASGQWQASVVTEEAEGEKNSFQSSTHNRAELGRRTHLALVADGKVVRFFIDGHLEFHQPLPRELKLEGAPIGWGGKLATDMVGFPGILDEIRISKVARYVSVQDFDPPQRHLPDEHTLALYHCDEGTGDVLNDSSANQRHGKIFGAKWVVASAVAPPPVDYALEFAGTSLVDIPSLERDAAEPLTIEAWVKDVGDHTGVLACIRGKYPAQMHLSSISDGKYLCGGERLPDGKLWRGVSIEETINFASWTHCAYVIDERGATLFVDGKKAGEHPKADYAPPWTGAYHPGASIGGDADKQGKAVWTLWGSVRELRFSNSVRYDRDFTPRSRFSPDATTLALYHFDEGTGDVLNDSSGHKHHGKIVGAKWVAVATAGRTGLEFEKPHTVEVKSLVIDRADNYTLEAWVTPWDQARQAPITFLAATHEQTGLFLGKHWQFNTLAGKHYRMNGGAFVAGRRTHIAGVRDGAQLRLYVDGRLANMNAFVAGEIAPPNGTFQIGGGFEGIIDQVRVSKSARYTSDFSPADRFATDQHTLAVYNFDEGDGDELRDISGNNHHGKIVGAKWVLASGGRESPDSALAPAASRSITPANGMFDLLPLIDIARDKVVGVWEQDADGLHLRTKQGNQIEQFSRLALPVVPAAGSSYRVQVKFTALQDGRGMGLILPIGDRQAMAGVAIVGGLGLVDGKQIGAQGNPTICNPRIKAGTQYTLDVWVRPASDDVEVEAHFEGSELFRWQGKMASLALHDDWKMPRADVLGLCEWSLVPFTVQELKLEMLTGEARIVEAK